MTTERAYRVSDMVNMAKLYLELSRWSWLAVMEGLMNLKAKAHGRITSSATTLLSTVQNQTGVIWS
jgi:hypothetical protein